MAGSAGSWNAAISASRPSWNQENRRKYHEVSRKEYENAEV